MISKSKIHEILSGYDKSRIKIATICSHSALQIFHGSRKEGFKTIGICMENRKLTYDSFPLAKPDEYLIVNNFKDILGSKFQKRLIEQNVIVVPHGSFVAYVGSKKIKEEFMVPILGNRVSLEWESNRKKQREWLQRAGLKVPKEYKSQADAGKKVFVKYPGAKGGSGYFTAESDKGIAVRLALMIKKGLISEKDAENITIQEFIPGVRYYPHYFYSLTEGNGPGFEKGRLELLSMDKRIEPIDESYRGLPNVPEDFFDYTVTGNQEVILRESLLPAIMKMGIDTVNASKELFNPGITGPFCLETVFHPKTGFTVFEISARIVAGTNLFPEGSSYSPYIFDEPMSTGRRISREIKRAIEKNMLEQVVY